MYPNLYYLFKDLFHIDIPFLKIVNSFGFFVALSFLVAAWVFSKELKRKEALGEFTYIEKIEQTGKPASMAELLLNFILGFVFGFKIIGVFLLPGALDNPQGFIFSSQGSWLAGLGLGLFFSWLKWREKNKSKSEKPVDKTIRVWPSDRVSDIVIISAVAGFIGAKIFDNLENWDRFIQDPIGNMLSPSGLTFYGGLILATLVLWYYFSKNKIPFIRIADAAAPALILAYGLGRIGCQVAGDGDWGIVNTFPKPFAWMPDWFWSFDYAHNVNSVGIPIPGCTWGEYCFKLPQGVFPTPLYEIIASLLIFVILWSIRKKIKYTGRMFAIYLILNGIERFSIELIRVNTRYSFWGIHPSQAELIATFLFVFGILLYWLSPKFSINKALYEKNK
ncbi:MAG: prolipoprotein diacylglyceryl transferase [Bacteroidetes bacterium]|nr:prolipoprotein diacylglyceryl transferase [Bacteroidota bacterium]